MIRRILSGAAAGVLLAMAPSAALAYEGDTEDVAVSDTNPAPGESFSVTVDAGPDSDEATLTVTSSSPTVSDDDIAIAGSQSLTKATDASGSAQFTVTLYAEDTYTLTGFDEAGNVVGETVVVVGDGAPGAGSADTPQTGTPEQAGVLPATGSDGTLMIAGAAGVLLLAAGGTLLLRRRGTTKAL